LRDIAGRGGALKGGAADSIITTGVNHEYPEYPENLWRLSQGAPQVCVSSKLKIAEFHLRKMVYPDFISLDESHRRSSCAPSGCYTD
jgi:hypothetical protein